MATECAIARGVLERLDWNYFDFCVSKRSLMGFCEEHSDKTCAAFERHTGVYKLHGIDPPRFL